MSAIIGIICSENTEEDFFFLRQDYVRALERTPALPVLLPITKNPRQLDEYLSVCQGIILSGGGDISPEFLEVSPEEKNVFTGVDAIRDACELYLIQQAIRQEIPLLGICRGCQMLNVALGGTLISDLHPDLHHMQTQKRAEPTHRLHISETSLLRTFTSESSPAVNSFHHQAILQPGKQLQVTAYAPDGVIEAVEHSHLPFCMGVQWHPEALSDSFSQGLFSAFVQIALQVQKASKPDFFRQFYRE